jgi:Protein of unknown function (DUF669)
MSDSLFGDLDVASAEDNPFKIPDNSYAAFVSDVKVGPTKDGSKQGMTIHYEISQGDHMGKSVREWKHIVQPANPKQLTSDEARSASFLKQRLTSLGIPADRMNKVTPEDIIGSRVVIRVQEDANGYAQVKNVEPLDD